MDTFIVILVLIILFVLLGGAAWFFGKEAGPGSSMAWLTGTRSIRGMFTQIGDQDSAFSSQQSAVMVDNSRMHALADELREEVMRTSALGREFGNRLQTMESEFTKTRQLPAALNARVLDVESDAKHRIASLRQEINQHRRAESPYNLRRNDAVRDLYQKLAQIDVALGAVVNPMLLPGEPVSVPETLYEDTLEWNNWGDVADSAYAFGEAFSKQRVVLDPAFADRIEQFISNFREALTDKVYPIVQANSATPAQKAQMRDGIVTVVDGITPLRREFEQSWLSGAILQSIEMSEDDSFDA